MDGILNVNKPSGPTSHDVVARIRRITGEKRVGHAGTLDPLASGVLLVCLGRATRIVEYLMDLPKSYRATAVFGVETDTEDATGSVIRESDCSPSTRDMVEAILPEFTGQIQQIPPMASAVHHEGQRLYELARKGEVVERQPRTVEIYSLRFVDFQPGERPTATLDIECSKGTYVRTLCADIGRRVDCGAHMASLIRTGVGPFRVEDSATLEEIEQKASAGKLGEVLHSMDEALGSMPSIEVSNEEAMALANGMTIRINMPNKTGVTLKAKTASGIIAAIGKTSAENSELVFKPDKVFIRPDEVEV